MSPGTYIQGKSLSYEAPPYGQSFSCSAVVLRLVRCRLVVMASLFPHVVLRIRENRLADGLDWTVPAEVNFRMVLVSG